jgi:putative Holliday junction resolvase
MRIVGVDVGKRRIGIAISDATGTLARPLATLAVPADARHGGVDQLQAEIARLAAEEDGVSQIVIGVPRALDGTATDQTTYVNAFIDRLRSCTAIPVVIEDERLTSREAESRLALRERDWRKRKALLDAAAAAIILQDYLDRARP